VSVSAAIQRAHKRAEEGRAKRDRARETMPESAAIVDDLRKHLDVAWVRMTENGQTLEGGKRTKDREVPPIPGVR
jgi:hypothetical protein